MIFAPCTALCIQWGLVSKNTVELSWLETFSLYTKDYRDCVAEGWTVSTPKVRDAVFWFESVSSNEARVLTKSHSFHTSYISSSLSVAQGQYHFFFFADTTSIHWPFCVCADRSTSMIEIPASNLCTWCLGHVSFISMKNVPDGFSSHSLLLFQRGQGGTWLVGLLMTLHSNH